MASNMANMKTTALSRNDIRRMIKSKVSASTEVKASTYTLTGVTMAGTGAVAPISQGIIQGIGNGQRTGNDIMLTKLSYKINTFAVGASGIARYVLVQDHENLGSTPNVTDILDGTSVVSELNTINTISRQRFKVLDDFTVVVPINGEAYRHYERTITSKLAKPVTFLGTTNVVTANGKNAIFLVVIGTATNLYDFSFQMSYTDK